MYICIKILTQVNVCLCQIACEASMHQGDKCMFNVFGSHDRYGRLARMVKRLQNFSSPEPNKSYMTLQPGMYHMLLWPIMNCSSDDLGLTFDLF